MPRGPKNRSFRAGVESRKIEYQESKGLTVGIITLHREHRRKRHNLREIGKKKKKILTTTPQILIIALRDCEVLRKLDLVLYAAGHLTFISSRIARGGLSGVLKALFGGPLAPARALASTPVSLWGAWGTRSAHAGCLRRDLAMLPPPSSRRRVRCDETGRRVWLGTPRRGAA